MTATGYKIGGCIKIMKFGGLLQRNLGTRDNEGFVYGQEWMLSGEDKPDSQLGILLKLWDKASLRKGM